MTQDNDQRIDFSKLAPVEDIGWDEIGGDLFRFETAGDRIEGVLAAKGLVTVANPQGGENVIGQYFIRNAEGPWIVNGGANLDGKLAQVQDGANVRITYLGTVLTAARRTVKTFKVQVHS